jgi:hypothetical protein
MEQLSTRERWRLFTKVLLVVIICRHELPFHLFLNYYAIVNKEIYFNIDSVGK